MIYCEVTRIHTLAKSITAYFFAVGEISEDEQEVCEYGVELFLAGIVNVLFVFITSIILKTMIYGVVFLVIIIPTRALVGGYHAKSHFRCNVYFVCTYLISLRILKSLKLPFFYGVIEILTMVGLLTVRMFAPFENSNKIISSGHKKKYNKISLILYGWYMIIAFFVKYKDQELSLYINIILIITVVLLLIGLSERRLHFEKESY